MFAFAKNFVFREAGDRFSEGSQRKPSCKWTRFKMFSRVAREVLSGCKKAALSMPADQHCFVPGGRVWRQAGVLSACSSISSFSSFPFASRIRASARQRTLARPRIPPVGDRIFHYLYWSRAIQNSSLERLFPGRRILNFLTISMCEEFALALFLDVRQITAQEAVDWE